MTALDHLTIAEEHLQSAMAELIAAALDAPTDDCRDHAKAIAARVRNEANNVYALGCSIGGADLTASLERALGAPAAENCS